MTVRRNAKGEYLGLGCDTCGKPAPSTAEIMKAHGLNRLGWHCSGGTHICDTCPQPAASVGSRA